MSCHTIEDHVTEQNPSLFQRAAGLVERLAGGISLMPKLDLDTAPDRVKRDLGFLDGRDPRYEDERLR